MEENQSVYHVVCRECTTESLASQEREARRRARTHAAASDHRVAYAKVDTRTERVVTSD